MVELSYGPDKHGLICGYLFEAGQPGAPISLDDTVAWLRSREGQGGPGFVWLHFNLTTAGAEAWMQHNLPVVPEFFQALREGSRSTRIEDASDTLVAVVNDVAFEFSFDPSEIETLWLNVGPRMAISARVHPLQSIDRLRHSVRQGCCFDSPVAFLNHLMHDQGDVLVRIVREATVQVDRVEDGLLLGRLKNKRADLGKLRRVLVRLQRLLAPEPGALFRLLNQPPAWIATRDVQELRHSTEEFSAVLGDMTALQERIKLLQEEVAARVTEETNRSVFVLTMVTVLALPINMIAGLLGMNVGGIPLAEHEHGFWIVVAIIASFTLAAAWWAFRRRED